MKLNKNTSKTQCWASCLSPVLLILFFNDWNELWIFLKANQWFKFKPLNQALNYRTFCSNVTQFRNLVLHFLFFNELYKEFKGFSSGASGKEPAANAGDVRDTGSIPGLERSPEGGHGNPLQHCLGNLMNRGAWQATVRGVTESDMTERLCTTQREVSPFLSLRHLGEKWLQLANSILSPSTVDPDLCCLKTSLNKTLFSVQLLVFRTYSTS